MTDPSLREAITKMLDRIYTPIGPYMGINGTIDDEEFNDYDRPELEAEILSLLDRAMVEAVIKELESHKDERCICFESGLGACDALWHHNNNIDDRIATLKAGTPGKDA